LETVREVCLGLAKRIAKLATRRDVPLSRGHYFTGIASFVIARIAPERKLERGTFNAKHHWSVSNQRMDSMKKIAALAFTIVLASASVALAQGSGTGVGGTGGAQASGASSGTSGAGGTGTGGASGIGTGSNNPGGMTTGSSNGSTGMNSASPSGNGDAAADHTRLRKRR
jgi:hypothetical protein